MLTNDSVQTNRHASAQKTNSKVGVKRIDAALDALRAMGFPEALVRRTVRNLLKVYGGDESWSFIEENSYRLLIDSILEEQEKSERENYEPKLLENSDPPLLIENGVSKDNAEEQVNSIHGQSKRVPSPNIESSATKTLALQVSEPVEAVPCSNGETCDAKLGRASPTSQISAGMCSSQLFCLPQVESLPAQRSKPCYGWLSDDEE
ncbi:probable inactive histone-lysine N-methyltransferase SUVR1 isoform X2 [Manihot esculenta]|uniref:probable inactive histone-lysine N-methyltransferase SUVR1 isoform X2 n=1 Tax=Manihot esculenta TaxID=3983 RepID=UPI000B5D2AE4|nr:probable inactive histone-lysine N-methyltransferase SUVR1 isoform X2 [Manihot esculenta]